MNRLLSSILSAPLLLSTALSGCDSGEEKQAIVVAKSSLARVTDPQVSTADGAGLSHLSDELAGKPGVDMVAPFGTSLHVSGRDAAALDAAIAPYRQRKDLDWKRSEPSLEDVFIDLMGKARDNFQ